MHKMMVLAKAVSGRVEELAHWYDEQHINDLLAVPGLVSAERHTIMPVKRPEGTTDWDFMLIYELAGDDPMTVLRNMAVAKVPVVCDALESTSTLSLIAISKFQKSA
jgi:hypothetical protein